MQREWNSFVIHSFCFRLLSWALKCRSPRSTVINYWFVHFLNHIHEFCSCEQYFFPIIIPSARLFVECRIIFGMSCSLFVNWWQCIFSASLLSRCLAFHFKFIRSLNFKRIFKMFNPNTLAYAIHMKTFSRLRIKYVQIISGMKTF